MMNRSRIAVGNLDGLRRLSVLLMWRPRSAIDRTESRRTRASLQFSPTKDRVPFKSSSIEMHEQQIALLETFFRHADRIKTIGLRLINDGFQARPNVSGNNSACR